MRAGEQAVDVAGGVGVETDQLALVIDAVDGGRPDAVRVIDRLEAALRGPGEAVHHCAAAGSDLVDAYDLVAVVDPEGLGLARSGHVQDGHAAASVEQEADDVAVRGVTRV